MIQDRFRFRCFWEDDKQMHYFDNYCMPHITKEDEKIAHIMQCTGLKDKNGKLIFEGDIVKFRDYHHNWLKGKIIFEVKDATFVNEYPGADGKKDWDYVSRYGLEVIGNIYENPELMEDE